MGYITKCSKLILKMLTCVLILSVEGLSCQLNDRRATGKALPTSLPIEDSVSAESTLKDSLQKDEISDLAFKSLFIPDSTINSKLMLENPNTFSTYLSDQSELTLLEKVRTSPGLLFLSKSGEEYLFAYFYEGNSSLAFSYFEIGINSGEEKLTSLSHIQTEEESFQTESGIGIGTSLEELISRKGQSFRLESDSLFGMYYMGPETNFVKRYRMLSYEMRAFFKEREINKLLFGFTYP